MNIHVNYGLPFVSVTIQFRNKKLALEKVLLDTGSAGTIFRAAALIIDSTKMQVYSGTQ